MNTIDYNPYSNGSIAEMYAVSKEIEPNVLEVTWDGEDENIACLIMECLNHGFEVHVYRS